MTKPRDNQRQRLYDAEDSAALRHSGVHWQQTIPNDRLQGWVDRVMMNRAVQSRWGIRQITVELTKGGGRARYRSTIALGKSARNEWVTLHEIAHCLAWGEGADHGPEYAGVLLFLVRTIMGKAAGDQLRDAYKRYLVRYTMSAVPPAGVYPVQTKAEIARTRRAAIDAIAARVESRRPKDRQAALLTLETEVKKGYFGPAGSATRKAALATIRALRAG